MFKSLVLMIAIAALALAQSKTPGQAQKSAQKSAAKTEATIQCTRADGKPCNSGDVAEIAQGMATGRRVHKPFLAEIKSVTGNPDGTLVCTQNNGQPCNQDQVKALDEVAAATKCRINYNSSKSNSVTK